MLRLLSADYMNCTGYYKLWRRAWLTASILIVAEGAYADNWTFLKETPIAKFDDEDVRLLLDAANAAVADAATPAQRQWKNERTGHYGELRTLASFAGPNGAHCKRLRVTNHASGRESKATYTLCDLPPKGWQWVPSDFAPAPKRNP